MYLSFYNLRQFPFSLTFEEKFFYESPIHAEALANMTYTVQQRKGMVLVTGEVGAGKTFVGNMLVASLGVGCTTVTMRHPPRSEKQLLRCLAGQLGMSVPNDADELALVEDLETHLVRLRDRGRLVAMIIDEAQDLTPGALEGIRLLWNWEHNGERLVQIVLISQPELRRRLFEPEWESLRQRIVLSYHLGRLSAEETAAYISHRLRTAAEDGSPLEFTPEAKAEVHEATGGVPRLINVVCDNALLLGYADGKRTIDRSIVSQVLRDRVRWGLQESEKDATADEDVELLGQYEPVEPAPISRLTTRCPRCKTGYEVRPSKIGKKSRCRICGERFEIALVAED